MDATNENKWLVVDGLQRLTTLKRFVLTDELRLSGLEFLTQLHGKAFKNLPRNFQRRIAETQVTVYLIEQGTPSGVKFNIFKRINTGGLPLSAQEIRHALNQGRATAFLAQLANSNDFKSATDHGIRDDRMADRECVLRFLAFTITPYHEYKMRDFDSFLNDTMASLNVMPDRELSRLADQFSRAMRAALAILDKDAFRKPPSHKRTRYPINKALFETWSVNISRLDDDQIQKLRERKETLKDRFVELMNDREFEGAISLSTGDIRKVRRRFEAIEQIIKGVLS